MTLRNLTNIISRTSLHWSDFDKFRLIEEELERYKNKEWRDDRCEWVIDRELVDCVSAILKLQRELRWVRYK